MMGKVIFSWFVDGLRYAIEALLSEQASDNGLGLGCSAPHFPSDQQLAVLLVHFCSGCSRMQIRQSITFLWPTFLMSISSSHRLQLDEFPRSEERENSVTPAQVTCTRPEFAPQRSVENFTGFLFNSLSKDANELEVRDVSLKMVLTVNVHAVGTKSWLPSSQS